jgi:glucose 1-dehydrogenase
MLISLDQQVALITGASSGIGAATAKALATTGAAVVINYNSQAAPAEELARTINAEGGRAIAIGADVSKEADIEWLLAQTLDASDYIVGTTLFIDGGMSLYPEFRGNG